MVKNVSEDIVITGSDPDNDPLTFSIRATPARGVLSLPTPVSATSAKVNYVPDTNATYNTSFTFRVNDGKVNSNTPTVNIQVKNSCPALAAPGGVKALRRYAATPQDYAFVNEGAYATWTYKGTTTTVHTRPLYWPLTAELYLPMLLRTAR